MTYAVVSERRTVPDLTTWLIKQLAARFWLPKESQINRVGGVDREIQVDIDPFRLQLWELLR